jgi:hypothetical protein
MSIATLTFWLLVGVALLCVLALAELWLLDEEED